MVYMVFKLDCYGIYGIIINIKKTRSIKMRHILLISHGYLSSGMVSAIEMLSGKQENVSYIAAYTDGETNITQIIKDKITSLENTDELIILTDILGGSTTNAANENISSPNVHVVAGINLAFVLELLLDEGTPTAKLIRSILISSREAMVYCNDEIISEDEDF